MNHSQIHDHERKTRIQNWITIAPTEQQAKFVQN